MFAIQLLTHFGAYTLGLSFNILFIQHALKNDYLCCSVAEL